jgi:hypothetical protein
MFFKVVQTPKVLVQWPFKAACPEKVQMQQPPAAFAGKLGLLQSWNEAVHSTNQESPVALDQRKHLLHLTRVPELKGAMQSA